MNGDSDLYNVENNMVVGDAVSEKRAAYVVEHFNYAYECPMLSFGIPKVPNNIVLPVTTLRIINVRY